jgi:hypothetical protein
MSLSALIGLERVITLGTRGQAATVKDNRSGQCGNTRRLSLDCAEMVHSLQARTD